MSLSLKKACLWLILLMPAAKGFAQSEPKIYWHADSLLTWNDFKGPIDASSSFSAVTHYGTSYYYQWHQHLGKYTFTFTTKSYVEPNRSWTKVEKQTPELLRHEQLHFDIAEFFARQLLVALNAGAYTTAFEAEIKQVYADVTIKRQAMEELYDSQTNHSRNKLMQAQWEIYVYNLLNNQVTLEDAITHTPVLAAKQ